MAITKTSYGSDKNILIAPELAFSIGCIVGNTALVADADGKKIIKAGTPVGGATSVLTARDTVLVSTNTAGNGATAQGVVLFDVDVTNGNNNATLIISGFVDLLKLDVAPVAEAITKLTKITFIKGAK